MADPPSRAHDRSEHPSLLRILRVRDGLAVTVGIVIGAGILRTPGLIAGYLGDPWLILGVWTLGGVVAGMSTLLLAEMAAAFPHAGGKYVYAREAFGPVAGFVAGWSELLVTRAFSGAAKAVVIAEYIILLTGRGSIRILAGLVILSFALVHFGGLKIGTQLQNVTTAIKVAVLAAIAVAGIWAGNFVGLSTSASFAPEYAAFLGFALAYQAVAFAYYGWEDAAKMAEETRDAGRSLPRILLGGAAAVAVLYLLVNIAFLAALTPAEMAGSPLVAQDAIEVAFGETAGVLVLFAGLLILISSLNVNFLGMPRVAFGLARDRLAPRSFTEVTARGTPGPGLVFITVVILGLALTGAFEWLIRFMMLVAISVDLVVLLGFFRLRQLRPDQPRPFTVPGYPWFPGLTIVLYIALLTIIVATQPDLTLGAGAMLGGLLVAGVLTARAKPAVDRQE